MQQKRTYLRKARHQKRMSIKKVAKELGIDWSHLASIERGSKSPSITLINKLEDFFGIPQRKLLKRDDEK